MFRELKQLWDTFTCVGRLICPEGRVVVKQIQSNPIHRRDSVTGIGANALLLMCQWSWSWWRHQMETFSALLANCAGNSPVPGEIPAQRPVTRSFVVFFDLRLNKWLSKQSWGWWFGTLSYPLWRHCNVYGYARVVQNHNKAQQDTNMAYNFWV